MRSTQQSNEMAAEMKGGQSLPVFTREEVYSHRRDDDAWIVHGGKVYDLSKFLERHPGGQKILLEHSGKDVTTVMSQETPHRHSKFAYGWMGKFLIGRLQGEHEELDKTLKENLHMEGYKEEMVDWSKSMLWQVGKLGPEYLNWVHSPVDRPLRLFESSFCEIFSRTPWYLVPIIWLPVMLYFQFLSIHSIAARNSAHDSIQLSIQVAAVFCVQFFSGVLVWTFIEYCLHRFVFHLLPPPNSPWRITFHFFIHGQHHKTPFDKERLVFPPVAAAVIASIIYSILWMILPEGMSTGVFSGGLFGYIMYDMIHYYLHHGSPIHGSYFHQLKRYHVVHHFEDQQNGFGISSKLWDFPFGTHPSKKAN